MMKYINNMKQFLNENENVNGKITFSIKIISKRTFLSDGYHGYNEAMLKFKNYDSDIDKLLDNINIFDQMSIILNSDEISGNFGKYKFEFEDEQQIDDIINLLIKNGFYFKKNKKINNSIYYIDLKKMSNNKYSFYTSHKKNIVTEYDYVKNGELLNKIFGDYIDYDDYNYIIINEMENFHIITFDNNTFLNNVINLIKKNLTKGNI